MALSMHRNSASATRKCELKLDHSARERALSMSLNSEQEMRHQHGRLSLRVSPGFSKDMERTHENKSNASLKLK
jgi:hypothetical protein